MSDSWEFRIVQDGIGVACVDSPDFALGLNEIGHYAMMYGQDGPVEMQIKKAGEWWKLEITNEE